jgi:hypothetical protein
MLRECLHGGVLSPLLWSLVVGKLLRGLHDDYWTLGFVDDIAILINAKFPQNCVEVLQPAVGTVQQTKPSTSISKTVIIPFTGKRDLRGLEEPSIFSRTIQLSSKVKYLGLTLNKALTRKKQLNKIMNKALETFGTLVAHSGETVDRD